MKLFKDRILLTGVFAVALLILFSSCMPEPADPRSQLAIGVRLNDLDSPLTAGNDSLRITRVRFIHGKSFFTMGPDSTLPLTFPRQKTLAPTLGGETALLINSVFPEDAYQGLTFKIARASSIDKEENPNFNPDPVFTDGGNYSIVINGMYNGNEFTFKAAKNFTYSFKSSPSWPVTVGSKAKVYQFLISTNMESWFINSQRDGFLNPADGKEKDLIYENISTSFTFKQISPQ